MRCTSPVISRLTVLARRLDTIGPPGRRRSAQSLALGVEPSGSWGQALGSWGQALPFASPCQRKPPSVGALRLEATFADLAAGRKADGLPTALGKLVQTFRLTASSLRPSRSPRMRLRQNATTR